MSTSLSPIPPGSWRSCTRESGWRSWAAASLNRECFRMVSLTTSSGVGVLQSGSNLISEDLSSIPNTGCTAVLKLTQFHFPTLSG